jgi:hypothetical protein
MIRFTSICMGFKDTRLPRNVVAFRNTTAADKEDQYRVDQLARSIGLTKQVQLRLCEDQEIFDSGAQAGFEGEGASLQPVILTSEAFLSELKKKTGNNIWSVLSLIAHELGHLFSPGDVALDSKVPKEIAELADDDPIKRKYFHDRELRADYFMGHRLRQLGAKLLDVSVALQTVGNEQDSVTHPNKRRRLEEVKKGFDAAPAPPEPTTAKKPASKPVLGDIQIPDGAPSPSDELEAAPAPRAPTVTQGPCKHLVDCSHMEPCRHTVTGLEPGPCDHWIPCPHVDPFYGPLHPPSPAHPYDWYPSSGPAHPEGHPMHGQHTLHSSDPVYNYDSSRPLRYNPVPVPPPSAAPAPAF